MPKVASGPVSLEQTRGHLRWRHKVNGKTQVVHVHQLVAIAHGEDPGTVFSNGEYHVHHCTDVRYDNRPDELDVLREDVHNALSPGPSHPGAWNWDELPIVEL